MTYTGLELFMEKLKQLIYSNDFPTISNHLPSILPVRPQLQCLYEELHSTIQILFTKNENHAHNIEEVRNLQKRFKEVAEEAHERVDLFVSVISFKHEKVFPNRSDESEDSLNLGDLMGSIKSMKKELSIIFTNMKMNSSPKTQSPAPAAASCSRNTHASNKRWDEDDVVGLDHSARLIIDKLVEDEKRLDVVSIVGMGGIGKTTLATKVFNDPFVVYHFHLRVWVTVSQTYEKRDLLIRILASIGIEVVPDQKNVYSKLREMLHKSLMGNRYLLVIDDIWNTKAWDDLKVLFPNNNTGSRILLTSRLNEVALHARPDGFNHQLEYLSVEKSYMLLCKKVFNGNDCPKSLVRPGMQIAKGCRGLPLALVVVAGILSKEATSKDSWEIIAQNVTSYVFKDPNRYIETLALSVNNLPLHLKDCFLYLGGFPEDYEFRATRLIWLWVAEGFIQETENQSLEEIAQGYLMELCDRNLVVIKSRKINGAVKTCSIHDVLRELCLEIATKESFCLKKEGFDHFMVAPYKTRRGFTDRIIGISNNTKIRSLLSFRRNPFATYIISYCLHSWMLLMVLDLQQCDLIYFPEEISLLLHLRYLAIRLTDGKFPLTICNLFSLQTLIIESNSYNLLLLPNTISNLVNLRHLWNRGKIFFPPIRKPMNLQTISKIVSLGDGPKSWVKYFPGVKRISCFIYPDMKYDFKSLNCLEILTINSTVLVGISRIQKKNLMFPVSLKKLTLKGCRLPWICMSKIQSLPKLEVLILLDDAFVGTLWDAGEEPFQQLKVLKLRGLGIKLWEASRINFPYLQQLVLEHCMYLKEIPIDIGYIPTLRLINFFCCNRIVAKSCYRIQKEQRDDGNFGIKVDGGDTHFGSSSIRYLYNHHSLWVPPLIILLRAEQINRPTNDRVLICYTRNTRTWSDKRSKRRPIRRKFSSRDGGLRLLQY